MFQIPTRSGEDGLPLPELGLRLPVPFPGLGPSLPGAASLVSLDFRLTCSVWRVYLHLISSHHARLANRLQLGATVELLSGEVIIFLERFREQFGKEAEEWPGEVAKMVTKAVAMWELILATGSAYPEHAVPSSCPHLLRLLLLLLSGLPTAPTWLPGPTRLRLQQEVTATNVQHGLVSLATTQPFLTFLLCFYTPCQEARAALLALPLASLADFVKLYSFRLASTLPGCLDTEREEREEPRGTVQ